MFRYTAPDMEIFFILHRAFHRDFNRELRAQSETRLHREYNLTS